MKSRQLQQSLSVVLLKGRKHFVGTSPPRSVHSLGRGKQSEGTGSRKSRKVLCAQPGVLVLSFGTWDLVLLPRQPAGALPTLGLLRKLSLLASLVGLAENSTVFAKTYTQGLDSTMLHQQLIIKLTRG